MYSVSNILNIKDIRKINMKNANNVRLRFELPTIWRHGIGLAGSIGEVLKEAGCRKPLLVTDKLLINKGIIEPLFFSLKRSRISYTVCDAVGSEPATALLESISDDVDLSSFDSVIAAGGGSVIDVSKGLAVLGTFGGRVADYYGPDKIPSKPRMKIFAIPTTAGTGSEVSDGFVVIDEERNTKFVVMSRFLRPDLAITDPGMTVSVPPWITACTGIDALIHAIEAYLSIKSNMATDLFALKAIELIAGGLEPAFKDGGDLEMRERMQIGATMAMIAASNTHVGMCHAMNGPICARYHIPHGKACGIVAPAVLEFNSKVVQKKILKIFDVMGFVGADEKDNEAIKRGCEELNRLLGRLGLLVRLSDLGYQESHLESMVTEVLNSTQIRTNPRQPTREEVEKVYRRII